MASILLGKQPIDVFDQNNRLSRPHRKPWSFVERNCRIMLENSHTLTVKQVLKRLEVDSSCGLSSKEAEGRLERFGRNGTKGGFEWCL